MNMDDESLLQIPPPSKDSPLSPAMDIIATRLRENFIPTNRLADETSGFALEADHDTEIMEIVDVWTFSGQTPW
jgi:hypothetical protein